MNLTNYHSHSNFCDGKAPLEDFVKSAIAAGFTAYGVSSLMLRYLFLRGGQWKRSKFPII